MRLTATQALYKHTLLFLTTCNYVALRHGLGRWIMGKWRNTIGGRAVCFTARVERDYRHTTAPPCQGRMSAVVLQLHCQPHRTFRSVCGSYVPINL